MLYLLRGRWSCCLHLGLACGEHGATVGRRRGRRCTWLLAHHAVLLGVAPTHHGWRPVHHLTLHHLQAHGCMVGSHVQIHVRMHSPGHCRLSSSNHCWSHMTSDLVRCLGCIPPIPIVAAWGWDTLIGPIPVCCIPIPCCWAATILCYCIIYGWEDPVIELANGFIKD